MTRYLALATIAVAAILVAGCTDAEPSPIPTGTADPTLTPTSVPTVPTPSPTATATPEPTATQTRTPTATPMATPTATPTPIPTITPTQTPAALSPAEVFGRVSPSLAFIDTPTGTGSGVLIEGGYVITNAHVVWPFEEVRVVFPNGSEFPDAPVLSWDFMADLAVIGPIEALIEPVDLVGREDLVTGSEVFLIGYPGETEQFPQAAITRGIISRTRGWQPAQMTYFQTDALVAGGQSGGALVSEDAEVIGISGFSFTEADFALVASAADIQHRIAGLVAGDDVSSLGDRDLVLTGGQELHTGMLRTLWDERMYIINEPPDTHVNIHVDSANDAAVSVIDAYGDEVIYVDDRLSGVESGSGNNRSRGALLRRRKPVYGGTRNLSGQ